MTAYRLSSAVTAAQCREPCADTAAQCGEPRLRRGSPPHPHPPFQMALSAASREYSGPCTAPLAAHPRCWPSPRLIDPRWAPSAVPISHRPPPLHASVRTRTRCKAEPEAHTPGWRAQQAAHCASGRPPSLLAEPEAHRPEGVGAAELPLTRSCSRKRGGRAPHTASHHRHRRHRSAQFLNRPSSHVRAGPPLPAAVPTLRSTAEHPPWFFLQKNARETRFF